ncbi:MAG: SDR family NAD(P)-dependent oxidoreductase [Chloroflexi bacterium]|nr:SDR family NAD(P)-dependent oxidoreductase [Chloroflexota bacterium]
MSDVRNKVVIITGSGQGIGRAVAEALAEAGAKVIIAEINKEKGEEVAKNISSKGNKAKFIYTDISRYDTVQYMVKEAIDEYGRIDVLINNAAIYYGIEPNLFTNISEEAWDKEMAVNVKGTWNCSRAVVPQFIKQGKGKIINVASGVAFGGSAYFMHYVASKGAIVSMTRAMARELAEMGGNGLTANTFVPSAVAGEASDRIRESMRILVHDKKPDPIANQIIKRRGTAQDMVGPLMFMVSEESDFMTASCVFADGGATHL